MAMKYRQRAIREESAHSQPKEEREDETVSGVARKSQE